EISSRVRYRHDPLHLLRNVRRGLPRAGDFFTQGLRHNRIHTCRDGASQGETARDRRSNTRCGVEMEQEEMSKTRVIEYWSIGALAGGRNSSLHHFITPPLQKLMYP